MMCCDSLHKTLVIICQSVLISSVVLYWGVTNTVYRLLTKYMLYWCFLCYWVLVVYMDRPIVVLYSYMSVLKLLLYLSVTPDASLTFTGLISYLFIICFISDIFYLFFPISWLFFLIQISEKRFIMFFHLAFILSICNFLSSPKKTSLQNNVMGLSLGITVTYTKTPFFHHIPTGS